MSPDSDPHNRRTRVSVALPVVAVSWLVPVLTPALFAPAGRALPRVFVGVGLAVAEGVLALTCVRR